MIKTTFYKALVRVVAWCAGATAFAATPVAMWDGDFTTATKAGYTLSLKNGGALPTQAGALALAADVLKIDKTTSYGKGAILIKYSGYTASDKANTALASAWPYNKSPDAGCEANGGYLKTYWGTTVDRPLDKTIGSYSKDNIAVPASGYLILAFNTETGTAAFITDANKSEWKGGYDSGIKWTKGASTVYGYAVGGPRNASPASTMGPCATMTVESVAVFEDYNGLDQAGIEGIMDYQFPSDLTVKGAIWGNMGTSTSDPGSCNGTTSGGNYTELKLNFSKADNMSQKGIGCVGKVKITKVRFARNGKSGNPPAKLTLTQEGGVSAVATPTTPVKAGVVYYADKKKTVTVAIFEYVFESPVQFDVSKNVALTFSAQAKLFTMKPANSVFNVGDYSPAIEVTGDWTPARVVNYSVAQCWDGVKTGLLTGDKYDTMLGGVPLAAWSQPVEGASDTTADSDKRGARLTVSKYWDGAAARTFADSGTFTIANRLPGGNNLLGYPDHNLTPAFTDFRSAVNQAQNKNAADDTITLSNIPFERYDAIVYFAGNGGAMNAVRVNDGNYYRPNSSVPGDNVVSATNSTWGDSDEMTLAYGTNVMRINGLLGSTLKLAQNCAAYGIAALQLVERPGATYEADVAGAAAFGALDWSPAKPEDGFTRADTLVIGNRDAASLTLDEPVTAKVFKVNNMSGHALTLIPADVRHEVGTFDFTEAFGGVTIDATAVNGAELATYAVTGAPYSHWLLRGKVAGTATVVCPAVPSGYAITSETLPGYGIRIVVTAPQDAQYGAVSLNIHNGTALTGDGDHGLYPADLSLWGNLRVANNATVTHDGLTFTLSASVSGYGLDNTPPDMIQKQYMDDADSLRTVTVGGMMAKGYSRYRVIVYFSTDTANTSFAPMSVTAGGATTSYAGPNELNTAGGATVKGSSATWGHSGPKHDANALGEGVNALVTDVLSDDTVVLGFRKTNGKRATPAAIQVVKIVDPKTYTATLGENKKWSELTWSPALPETLLPIDTLKIVATGSPTLTFDAPVTTVGNVMIEGSPKIAAALEDGCWSKTFLTATSFTMGTATFATPPAGFTVDYSVSGTGFSVRAQNQEVMSLNIAHNSVVSGTAYTGLYPVQGDTWMNMTETWNAPGRTVDLTGFVGTTNGTTTVARPDMSGTCSAQNTYQWTGATDVFLKGYLDDGGDRAHVTVNDIPYSKYDVIVYAATDSASGGQFTAPTVNGTTYTCGEDGVAFAGTSPWGAAKQLVAKFGVNAIVIKDLNLATLAIVGGANSGGNRGGIAAIQIINKGTIVEKKSFTATLTGDAATFGAISWNEGPFVPGSLTDATITIDGTEGEFALTMDDATLEMNVLKIVSARPVRIAGSNPALISRWDFSDVVGKVTFGFLPDLDRVVRGTYPRVSLDCTYAGTIASGFEYLGTGNVLTGATLTASSQTAVIGGTGTLSGFFGVNGSAAMTIGGTYTHDGTAGIGGQTGTVTIDSGADITLAYVFGGRANGSSTTLNVDGRLTIDTTSTDGNADRGRKGICFNEYGNTTFALNVNAGGSLVAENVVMCTARDGGAGTIAVVGGLLKIRGVNFTKTGNVLSVSNGGTLQISELRNQNNATYSFDGGTLKPLGADMTWTPGTTAVGAGGMTVDPDGGKMTLSGAFSGNGKLAVRDSSAAQGGTAVFTGDLSGFGGDIEISGGTAVFAGNCAGLGSNIKAVGGTAVFMQSSGIVPGEVAEAGGKVCYGFTVGINDLGRFPMPPGSGYTKDNVWLYNGGGEKVDATYNEETGEFEFAWDVTGKNCWWAYEFNGNLDSTGTDTTPLADELTDPYFNAASNALRVGYSTSYRGASYPAAFSAVMYGRIVDNTNHLEIGFGSVREGSAISVALACGDPKKEEVLLLVSRGFTVLKTVTMTVPSAYTADHLYIFDCKTVDDGGTDKTKVTMYLDGMEWDSYTFDGVVALGDGFQIGSVHGGVPTGYDKATTANKNAYLDFLRTYDLVLSDEAIKRYAEEYPYRSQYGNASRTFDTATATWTAERTWHVISGEGVTYVSNMPPAKASVAIRATVPATVTFDLDEAASYDQFKVEAGQPLTLRRGGMVRPQVAGLTTVGEDLTLDYDAIALGKVMVTEGKTLTFDCAGLDLGQYFQDTAIPLTGAATLGVGAQVVAVNIPSGGDARTAELRLNDGRYELFVSVSHDIPYVYTVEEGEETGVWTWNGEPVDASVVAALEASKTSAKIEKRGGGTAVLAQKTGFAYLVAEGVLKFSSVVTAVAPIEVAAGATFDVNGLPHSKYHVTLAGGSLVNDTDVNIGDASQTERLALTADSTVGGTGGFAVQTSSYGPTAIDLGTYVLEKTGTNQLALVNTTIDGTGTLYVREGVVHGSENTTFTNGILKIGENGTFKNRNGRTLKVANVVGEGGYFQNEGTVSAFALSGRLRIANSGTYGVITLVDGAVLDFGQKRNLTLGGTGSVELELTAAETKKASTKVFTPADGASITLGKVVYNGEDITEKCTLAGGMLSIGHEARIGDTYYMTLSEAIAAVPAGGTIVLLANVSLAENVKKSFALDVNGCVLSVGDIQAWSGWTLADGLGTGGVMLDGVLSVVEGGRLVLGLARVEGPGRILVQRGTLASAGGTAMDGDIEILADGTLDLSAGTSLACRNFVSAGSCTGGAATLVVTGTLDAHYATSLTRLRMADNARLLGCGLAVSDAVSFGSFLYVDTDGTSTDKVATVPAGTALGDTRVTYNGKLGYRLSCAGTDLLVTWFSNLWTDYADASGVRKEGDTYVVSNAAGFAWIAAQAANGWFAGTVELAQDIDLSCRNWVPVRQFTGTFDGKGHKITGLNNTNVVEKSGEKSRYPAGPTNDWGYTAYGLFASATNATFRNVVFEDAAIDNAADSAAALLGVHAGGDLAVAGVTVAGRIAGTGRAVAGLATVGGNGTPVGDVVVTGNVSRATIVGEIADGEDGGNVAQVLAGTTWGTVFTGAVVATNNVGAGAFEVSVDDGSGARPWDASAYNWLDLPVCNLAPAVLHTDDAGVFRSFLEANRTGSRPVDPLNRTARMLAGMMPDGIPDVLGGWTDQITALEPGATLVITNDGTAVELDGWSTVVVDRNVTIDLNGNGVYQVYDCDVFDIAADATLTITNGTISVGPGCKAFAGDGAVVNPGGSAKVVQLHESFEERTVMPVSQATLSPGKMTFAVPLTSGACVYGVETKPSLADDWQVVPGSAKRGNGGTLELEAPAEAPSGFYRVNAVLDIY